MDRPYEVAHDAQRDRPAASEVERLLSDNRLARELLGWAAAAHARRGPRATIEWLERHLHRYRPETYTV